MAEIARRSALAGTHKPGAYGANTDQPAVILTQNRRAALLRLFADTDDGDFGSVLRRIMALEFLRSPNIASESDKRALLWLAPGQCLLVCNDERSVMSELQLERALAGTTGTVVDVTHSYTVMEISGAPARDVLAKGAPVDLDAGTFRVGRCLQTCLAEMNVLLHARQAQVIALYVGRSYAASLWEWLTMSAAEFGYRVTKAPEASDV